MAALSDHGDSLPVTYDSESQDEISIPSLAGGPSEEVEMEESGDGDGDESSSRKREREDEEEQEAESAQSDIPDEPELKKQRTEEEEEGGEEEKKKPKYAWQEFLENAKVGSDKPYGIGVRNTFEDKKNHTTYMELPPAIVGRGKDGTGPFLSGFGKKNQEGKRQFFLPLEFHGKTPSFVKDVYPHMGEEQQAFIKAVENLQFERYDEKWESGYAEEKSDLKRVAMAKFEKKFPFFGLEYSRLSEETLIELLVATGKYDEDTAEDLVRKSGVTNKGAAKKNDSKEAMQIIFDITQKENEKARDDWVDKHARALWCEGKARHGIGKHKSEGPKNFFGMELASSAVCKLWEKEDPMVIPDDCDPTVAAALRENGLDKDKKRMKPPVVHNSIGEPIKNPETGRPLHYDMEPRPGMDPKMLNYEPLAFGDVVTVGGNIALVQTPTIWTVKFMPDFGTIKLLRRPKNPEMIMEALGEQASTSTFGADPFNY